MCWEAVTAISTAVGIIIILVGLIYANKQLKEARDARKMQAFAMVLEQLGHEHSRQSRRYVIKKFPKGKTDFDGLSEDERIKVESVLARFDSIGFLVSKKFLPLEDVADFIGISVVRCWDKLGNYVDKRRHEENEETGIESDYMRYFERLQILVWKHLIKTGKV